MNLRKATYEDIEDVMWIFAQARQAQRATGFRQWGDYYPSVDILTADIGNSRGYVLDDDGQAAGYVAIATSDEEYDRHTELWDVARKYAVFHRIALSDDYRGRGVSGELFDLAESYAMRLGADCVRIDTGLENKPMQHILAKRRYINLGRCDFVWGPRLAYEKPLR